MLLWLSVPLHFTIERDGLTPLRVIFAVALAKMGDATSEPTSNTRKNAAPVRVGVDGHAHSVSHYASSGGSSPRSSSDGTSHDGGGTTAAAAIVPDARALARAARAKAWAKANGH